MNGIESCYEARIQSECICLDKRKRIARLRLNVNADHVEAGFSVTGARAAGAETPRIPLTTIPWSS